MIWQLAWRNLWRHKTRTWITVLALSFITALLSFMLSFQFGSYETMKQQNLKLLSGYAQVQHKDFHEQPSLRHSFQLSAAWQNKLNQIPNLHFGLRAQTFAIASNLDDSAQQASLIMGVQPDKEAALSSLPNRIIDGTYFTSSHKNSVLIGKQLAEKLQLKIGDKLQLLGQDFNQSLTIDLFTVIGIFDLNSEELNQQLIQMPLADFQTFFAMQQRIQQLVFVTPQIDQAAELQSQFTSELKTDTNLRWRNWQFLQPQLAQAITLDLSSALVFYGILVFIVILILGNTLYMSLLERKNEFSLLHALGLQPTQIAQMTSIELMLSTLLGTLSGLMIGLVVSGYFVWAGINLPGTEEIFAQYGLSETLYPELSLISVLLIPVCFLIAAIVLSGLLHLQLRNIKPLTGRQL